MHETPYARIICYLVAIGLLLGGGYGALTWLAAPEPLRVVSKARPKQAPRQPAGSEGRPDVEQPKMDSIAANDGEHDTIAPAARSLRRRRTLLFQRDRPRQRSSR